MNYYGIPQGIEAAVRARDERCVYCGTEMVSTPGARNQATIEHLDHLPPFMYREGQTADDFAIACRHCNCTLRRDKPLAVFVREQGIAHRVAPVVTAFLNREEEADVTW